MSRIVVVGQGMVGSRFVETLLETDRRSRFQITVLGEEDEAPYNRVLLPEVISGRYDVRAITLPRTRHPRLQTRVTSAVAIDRASRSVLASDGTQHGYDVLVLATGSAARLPSIPGLTGDAVPPGAHVLRSLRDAREIVRDVSSARHAVVVGGGVLGLETACGLARRGLRVSVVHPEPALMERQLHQRASRAVESQLAGLGIDAYLGRAAEEVLLADGRFAGIRLSDGRRLDADLMVVAAGTTPRTGLACASGLDVERGIVVGPDLASPTDPRIFAIGDCAQPPGGSFGLVSQGWEQAALLATALSDPPSTHQIDPIDPRLDLTSASEEVIKVKADGLEVVTMGAGCASNRATRVLSLADPDGSRYVELRIQDDKLTGATCVGAASVATQLVTVYTRRTVLPKDPAHLLVGLPLITEATRSDPLTLLDDAIICRCNAVSKGTLGRAIDNGARSVADLATATRASTGCGGCREAVCALLAAAEPLLRLPTPGSTSGNFSPQLIDRNLPFESNARMG